MIESARKNKIDASIFKLERYFSIASFLCIVAVTIVLSTYFEKRSVQDLIEMGEHLNVDKAIMMSGMLGNHLTAFRKIAAVASTRELLDHPATASLDAEVRKMMRGHRVVKVKIYDISGKTIYSSEPKQIGEDKSANSGFAKARGGVPATELTHRNSFSSFEGIIENLDVLSSYVPMRGGKDGPVEGVFEIYEDVTPFLQRIARTQLKVIGVVIGVLMFLYVILFMIVRRADNILSQQANELRNSALELERSNNALMASNAELESFSYSVAHDLRAPLRAVNSFSAMALNGNGNLDQGTVNHLKRVIAGGERMGALIDDLLQLSRLSRQEMSLEDIDLSKMASTIVESLAEGDSLRDVKVTIAPDLVVNGDIGLIRVAMENLLGNAWKFSSKTAGATIEIGSRADGGAKIYCVRDNGAGFDMQYAHKLFSPFQRLHHVTQFEGTGIGLATVKKIIQRHHGKIWAESKVNGGTTVFFTIG
jgi:signal transduction histidine kinase